MDACFVREPGVIWFIRSVSAAYMLPAGKCFRTGIFFDI